VSFQFVSFASGSLRDYPGTACSRDWKSENQYINSSINNSLQPTLFVLLRYRQDLRMGSNTSTCTTIRKLSNLQFLWIILLVTNYSERIPVRVHGFRSIIILRVAHTQHALYPSSKTPHYHYSHSHRRQQKVSYIGRFRLNKRLYDASSDVLPSDTVVDPSSEQDIDDASDSVTTLRSVTFSNLPKDQGTCYIDDYYCP
jgi:hypothetical protein